MAIAIYGFRRGTNKVVQLDDASVVTDETVAMETPMALTAAVDMGPAGGTARLRHVAQAVVLSAATSVRVTPVSDGSEDPSQAETFALVTPGGPEQIVESKPAMTGTRFQVKIEFPAIAGACGLGEADIVLVGKRSTVNA